MKPQRVPVADIGQLRQASVLEFRGNGVREVSCPYCGTPLAMHHFMDGDYLYTMPSKYLVRLADGTFGKSRTGEIGSGPRAVALDPIEYMLVHCTGRRCGRRVVAIDYPPPGG